MNNNQTRGWQKDRRWLPELHLLRCTHSSSGWATARQLWEPIQAQQPWEAGESSSWQGLVEPGQQQPPAFGSLRCIEIHGEHQQTREWEAGKTGSWIFEAISILWQVIVEGKFVWWKGRTRNVKKEVSIAQFLRLSLGGTALDDFPVVGGGWGLQQALCVAIPQGWLYTIPFLPVARSSLKCTLYKNEHESHSS